MNILKKKQEEAQKRREIEELRKVEAELKRKQEKRENVERQFMERGRSHSETARKRRSTISSTFFIAERRS